MTNSQKIRKLQKYNAKQAEYIDQLVVLNERYEAIVTEIISYLGNTATGLFDAIKVAEWSRTVKSMKRS